MGDPWENIPDHLQAELGWSCIWPELGSNPQQWDDKQFRVLKISDHNHSAMEAAWTAHATLTLSHDYRIRPVIGQDSLSEITLFSFRSILESMSILAKYESNPSKALQNLTLNLKGHVLGGDGTV